MEISLKSGTIKLQLSSTEIVENISLAFCVSLLYVLCIPRPKGWKEGKPVSPNNLKRGHKIIRIYPNNLQLPLAAGLLVSSPSNYYITTCHESNNVFNICQGGNTCVYCYAESPCSKVDGSDVAIGCACGGCDDIGGGCGGCYDGTLHIQDQKIESTLNACDKKEMNKSTVNASDQSRSTIVCHTARDHGGDRGLDYVGWSANCGCARCGGC